MPPEKEFIVDKKYKITFYGLHIGEYIITGNNASSIDFCSLDRKHHYFEWKSNVKHFELLPD